MVVVQRRWLKGQAQHAALGGEDYRWKGGRLTPGLLSSQLRIVQLKEEIATLLHESRFGTAQE